MMSTYPAVSAQHVSGTKCKGGLIGPTCTVPAFQVLLCENHFDYGTDTCHHPETKYCDEVQALAERDLDFPEGDHGPEEDDEV